MLRCRIISGAGQRLLTHEGTGHDKSPSYMWLVLLAEEPHRLPAYIGSAPEVRLEQVSRDVVCRALDFSQQPESGVVENDVDAPEGFFRLREGVRNMRGLRHVEGQDEEFRSRVLRLQRVEDGRLAQRCYDVITVRQRVLNECATEAGRRSGN